MSDWLDEFAKKVHERYEKFLGECFARCGFGQDYILNHPEEFEVFSVNNLGESKTYYHLGKKLFTIYQHMVCDTTGEGRDQFFWTCDVSYSVEFEPKGAMACLIESKEA